MSAAAPVDPGVSPNPPAPPATATPIFTKEQVDQAVSNAVQREKDKLYSDLNHAKQRATENDAKVTRLEAEITALKNNPSAASQAEVDALRGDLAKAKTEASEIEGRMTKVLDDALTRQSETFSKREEARDLATFRQGLIASVGADGVIPEMVIGATREDIQKSFDASVAKVKEIKEATAKKTEEELKKTLKGALPGPVDPGAPSNTTDTQHDYTDWRKLPAEERTKKLKEMKEKAFAEAGLQMKR